MTTLIHGPLLLMLYQTSHESWFESWYWRGLSSIKRRYRIPLYLKENQRLLIHSRLDSSKRPLTMAIVSISSHGALFSMSIMMKENILEAWWRTVERKSGKRQRTMNLVGASLQPLFVSLLSPWRMLWAFRHASLEYIVFNKIPYISQN